MRMRKKKHGAARLMRCGGVFVNEPAAYANKWQSLFLKQAPLFVEIGCGKGGFIAAMAAKYPDRNFIALEKNEAVLVHAAEKVHAAGLTNVRLTQFDAADLAELFGEGECDGLYINFCDPWHKKRYEKRRLTYKTFLCAYRRILKSGGEICLKTDNRPLFDFSLQSFAGNGFTPESVTFDLHSAPCPDNVMTEYEQLFLAQGVPICRAVVRCTPLA